MKFPYRRYEVTPSPTLPEGVLYRPLIRLRVIGTTGDARLYALVDTGADETLLPRSVAEAIGAPIDESHSWPVAGLAGQQLSVAPASVELELTDGSSTHRWMATIGVIDFADPDTETAILGHAGCLAFFVATFDGEHHEVEVEPHAGFPS